MRLVDDYALTYEGVRFTVPGTLAGARVLTAIYATTAGVRLVGCTLLVFLVLFSYVCAGCVGHALFSACVRLKLHR